jgi:predicted nucleotidyltransferase
MEGSPVEPTGLLAQCRWPALEERYSAALREATRYIVERWQPVGIIASGTIIRGNPSPSSDLDLFVLHHVPERQRVQRFFGGVPAEIFVNPPERVERYFESGKLDGRPKIAHMLATGFVVYDGDPVVEQLRAGAVQVLGSKPEPSPERSVRQRYTVATWLEDAEDIAEADADLCVALLYKAVEGAVEYRFWDARQWQPRAKETLAALERLDAGLAARVRAFYRTADPTDRLRLAREIVRQTVGATGFFEWESSAESLLT